MLSKRVKRYLSMTLLLLCIFNSFTLQVHAQPKKKTEVMYLTKQSFSYDNGEAHYERAVGVLGKGEKVTVYGEAICSNTDDSFYKAYHFGETVYIPSENLTTEKPKYHYKVTALFKEIYLNDSVNLYTEPVKSSSYQVYDEKGIYTLGETNKWYKVYANGKVGFINKKDPAIKKVVKAAYPKYSFHGIQESRLNNTRKRLYYQFAMLPQPVIKTLIKTKCDIKIRNKLSIYDFEKNGNSGFSLYKNGDLYIEVKESASDTKYRIERSLLHEIGHAITYLHKELPERCFKEGKVLKLRSHYNTLREYSAEYFEYYIMEPEYLKTKTPISYQYMEEILKSI